MGCYRAAAEADVHGIRSSPALPGQENACGCKAGMGLDWCSMVSVLLAGKLGASLDSFGDNSWNFPCASVRNAPADGVRGMWVGCDPAWPPLCTPP